VTTATKLMGVLKRLLTSRGFDRLASRI